MAADAALQSELQFTHGAVVVRNGKAVGRAACNRYGKGGWEHSVHAEVAALREAGGRRSSSGGTLYVVRVGKDGSLRESHPCPWCLGRMRQLNVHKCIYSTNDGLRCIKI